MADQWIARLSTCDRRVWGSVGPWGFRSSVSAPGRSPTRPSVTFGAFIGASRARRLFTCALAPNVRTGDFEDLATAAVAWAFLHIQRARGLPAASPVRLVHSARPFPAPLPLLGLSKDRLSIGPPCWSPLPAPTRFPTLVDGASMPSRRGLPPRSRATRLRSDLTVSTVSPACSSCRLPGLRPAPILGFAAFPSASALASASFPAARFYPSKPCSPPNAATLAHAMVAAARHLLAVADTKFTEPLPSSSFRQSLSRPGGTSRVSSFCGAVPPCAVSSADGPLLPWACQSCD